LTLGFWDADVLWENQPKHAWTALPYSCLDIFPVLPFKLKAQDGQGNVFEFNNHNLDIIVADYQPTACKRQVVCGGLLKEEVC